MVSVFLKRAAALIGTIASWVYTLLDFFFDWVGRSTADDDARQLVNEKLPTWAEWLFSTPSAVPAICALALTAWLIWLSWPRSVGETNQKEVDKQKTLSSPPTTVDRISAAQAEEPSPDKVGKPTITRGPPRSWRPDGLHVGNINAALDNLASDLFVTICVSGYNATERNIIFERATGSIYLKKENSDQKGTDAPLRTPIIRYGTETMTTIAPQSEFLLFIEQMFSQEAAKYFIETFENGNQVRLDMDQLKVHVVVHGNADEETTLPLWAGIIVYKGGDRPMTGKVAKGEVKASLV